MKSIWTENKQMIPTKELEDNLHVDVAIIGGGMAGILTSYLLHERGIKNIILEANQIASGQTGNTTAKITAGHNLIYHKLIKAFNSDTARLYAKANLLAIDKYQEIIRKEEISCHYKTVPNYVYTLRDLSIIEDEVTACRTSGLDVEFTKTTSLPFDVLGAVKLPNQGQFNPIEFINKITPHLDIYEHTMVYDIDGNTLTTNKGKLSADKIVVATHYPFINSPGYYFLRQHQERSYVIALENAAILDGMYIDENKLGYSFRNYEDKLFLGGGNHRTGENSAGNSYASLRAVAKKYYPNSKECYHWSAQDAMTLDQIPYIGHYSSKTPNMYVATGFNKWGMTNSMIAGQILTDLIDDKKNPFEEVYTPNRFQITASIKNLIDEGTHAVTGLVKQTFSIPHTLLEDLPNGHGGIVDYNGEKVGVYKEMDGTPHVVTTKCSHLGCNLEWNPDELSWDCPCHGSRFDYDGNLLDNPAIKNIQCYSMEEHTSNIDE